MVEDAGNLENHQNPISMHDRLETFCDGIFAIAITLLILEIKVPSVEAISSSEALKHELLAHWPSWFAFLLSFVSLFIAWINHHHLMAQLSDEKTSNIFMYAHGLFILTLIVYPFTTSLLAEYMNTSFNKFPVLVYCFLNVVHSGSWVVLCHAALHPIDLGADANKSKFIANTKKNIIYTVIFNIAMCVLALWLPMVALSLTALAWLVYLVMGIRLTPVEEQGK